MKNEINNTNDALWAERAQSIEALEAARIETMRQIGIDVSPVTLPASVGVLAQIRAKYGRS